MTPEAPSDPPLRVLAVRGGAVAATDAGAGPVVVAVHGLPGSVRDYRWLGAALEPRLRLVRLDLPASGETPLATEPSPRARDRAEVIVRALDALDIGQATVLGHSMGGAVALAAAANWPDRFSHLVLLASVGTRPHRGYQRIPSPRAFGRLLAAPAVGHLLLPVYRRAMRAVGFPGSYSRAELSHMNRCIAALSFADNREAAARLAAPTMVAWADDDPMVEPEVSRALADAVPAGPRLGFATGGHNIQKSRAIEIAEALVPWIITRA